MIRTSHSVSIGFASLGGGDREPVDQQAGGDAEHGRR